MQVFCLTTDIDWANEEVIAEAYTFFKTLNVPVTPFITHKSAYLTQQYKSSMKVVGVHPNFLEGSTQGNNIQEVITYALNLNPEADGFRAHSYYDSLRMTDLMVQHGFKWDSNLALHLQSHIEPLHHASGLMRFPSWLEDYHYLLLNHHVEIKQVQTALEQPGLKIVNVHPIHLAFNTPSLTYYERHRSSKRENVTEKGVRDLTVAVVDHAKSLGYECLYLHDLYERLMS